MIDGAGRHAYLNLRLLHFSIGAWTASIAPFFAVILLAHGVDTATIGMLSAIAALAATVLVPAWGHLADVLAGRVAAFRIGVAIAVVASIALLFPLPIAVLAPVLASFLVWLVLFSALGDALAVGALAAPERQYGALRALGSLAFALGVVAAGFVYDQKGYGVAPFVSLVWSAALFVLAGMVPDLTRSREARVQVASLGTAERVPRFGSFGRAVAVQPRLLALLAVFALAYAGILGSMTFVAVRIVELGGQPSDVALSFAIAALAEIPGLVLAGWIVRRIGLRALIVLGLLVYSVCILSWGLLPTPLAINVTRVATGVCYGALTTARVLLIARILPGPLQATGQSALQAASYGFGSALGGLLGGRAYVGLGPTAYFAASAGTVLVGGAGAWLVLSGTRAAAIEADIEEAAALEAEPAASGAEQDGPEAEPAPAVRPQAT